VDRAGAAASGPNRLLVLQALAGNSAVTALLRLPPGEGRSLAQRAPTDDASSTGGMHKGLEARFVAQHGRSPHGGVYGEEYAQWLSQQIYNDAVALLKGRDQVLHGYLAQAAMGRSVRVKTMSVPIAGAGPGQPTQLEFQFDLEVAPGGLAERALAQFETKEPIPSMTAPVATVNLKMPLRFSVPKLADPAPLLAEYLYHEGIHMLVTMDRVTERFAPQSAHLQSGQRVAVDAYLGRVRNSVEYAVVLSDLEGVIAGKMATKNVPGSARPAALNVVKGVIDERFAIDRQRQQFPGNPVTNQVIAQSDVPNQLLNEGIDKVEPSVMARLVREMAAMLDLIPRP
jgi:hypothetical protein